MRRSDVSIICELVVCAVWVVGCTRNEGTPAANPGSNSAPPPIGLPGEFGTTPKLIKLFGGEANLSEVRHAWSSTHLSVPIPMYLDGRFAKLARLVGTAETYDFDRPVERPFQSDLVAHFCGKNYWEATNGGRNGESVDVHFDVGRKQVEVRVGKVLLGSASYQPGAEALEALFRELGWNGNELRLGDEQKATSS
jgi:hypothetical protein